MKRLFMVFLFVLISSFAFSQNTGEIFTGEDGTDYIITIPWTLNKMSNGMFMQGEGQGVYNTPSFYWQLVRTFSPNDYGYYTYYLRMHSNAMYWDASMEAYTEYDVILRNLFVYEDQNLIYSNSIFYIDRKGTGTVVWVSGKVNSIINFSHSDSGAKKPVKERQVYKDGGY